MDSELERDLVNLARIGDPAAAPFLVSYLGDHLLGYARSISPDLGDADREKIVELAIEAGVRTMHRYDETRGGLRGWFRRQVQWKTSEWRRSGPPTTGALPTDPVTEPGDATSLPDALTNMLRAVIADLPPDDQVLLALRAVEGLGFAEIGIRLGINTDSARQRYKRLRDKLSTLIHDQPELFSYLQERGVT